MSGAMASDDQPRASTSKEGADPRISISTTPYQDLLTADGTPPSNAAELRGDVAGSSPGGGDNTNILLESTSSLDKLQTYLPTGTWVMYTALQTWAFSLNPGSALTSATSNCNTHQRIALSIVLCLSAVLAFLSSFVKRFVYDSDRIHVLYPPPDLFNVARHFTDPLTGVKFPCRTKGQRYCWPLATDMGELTYDQKGGRLRVLVFKPGIKVHVRRKIWYKRVWNSLFKPEEEVPEAPRLSTSPGSRHMSLLSNITRMEGRNVVIDIDDAIVTAPKLYPRWTRTLVGAFGSKAYLDLRPCVWAHALVSVFAFASLALLSTQVSGCIYPSIPDYLPPTVQTVMLILLSLAAALFIRDDAVSLGQTMPRHTLISSNGAAAEIPAHLRAVVDMVVWIRRQDVYKNEEK
ncbi:hypothetical protein JB92DRAFT_3273696 [Gautieria morchelliformis]|nr:hypothetical protein JB92DRAFT_3273696 [Gautieria morchelliformis]